MIPSVQSYMKHYDRPVPEARMIRMIEPYHPACQGYHPPNGQDDSPNVQNHQAKQRKQLQGHSAPLVSLLCLMLLRIWDIMLAIRMITLYHPNHLGLRNMPEHE